MDAISEELMTRISIEDAVVRMFVATEERDWPTLASCFMDPVVIDMTSMVGGTPTSMTHNRIPTGSGSRHSAREEGSEMEFEGSIQFSILEQTKDRVVGELPVVTRNTSGPATTS